jgi:hypothetical protein
MTVPRPVVFVSSPIHEFADLRDALKFWLEEMDFQVQMSEHTDFRRRPEVGTFEACFESIRDADYYVLLIGCEIGSWYDKRDRVSVTQKEYRIAYDSLLAVGKPKIMAFVRRDVLTILEERQTSEVSAESKSKLVDPVFTDAFIREVRREREARRAATGQGLYPPANWLTGFATFRELTDGLRSALRIRGPLAKMAVLENLRHELARNLRMTMTSFNGRPSYHHLRLANVRRDVQLRTRDTLAEAYVQVAFEHVNELVAYSITGPPAPDVFVRYALDDAISSRALLDYDTEQDRFVASPLLKALYRLREEMDIYATRHKAAQDYQPELMALWDEARHGGQGAKIPGFRLALVFALHDNEQNIVRLLIATLRHLYEHTDTIDVMYRPISPIVGMDELLNAEVVSQRQVEDWLESDNPLLRVGTVDLSEDQRQATKQKLGMIEQIVGKDKLEEALRRIMEGEGDSHSDG